MNKDDQDPNTDETDDDSDSLLDTAEWDGLVHSFSVLYPQSEHKATSKLTRKQKLVAYAVSLGWPQATIAKMAGNVHRNSIKNWLKDPDFIAFVSACSYVNPISKVNDYIKNELIGVAKVIRDIAMSSDPNVKKETKLDAAKTFMKQALGDPEQNKTITIRDLYNQRDKSKRDIIAEDLAKLVDEEDKTH